MRRALNWTAVHLASHTQCAEVYRPALNLASSCRELPGRDRAHAQGRRRLKLIRTIRSIVRRDRLAASHESSLYIVILPSVSCEGMGFGAGTRDLGVPIVFFTILSIKQYK